MNQAYPSEKPLSVIVWPLRALIMLILLGLLAITRTRQHILALRSRVAI